MMTIYKENPSVIKPTLGHIKSVGFDKGGKRLIERHLRSLFNMTNYE